MVDQTAGAPRRIPSVGIGVLGYSFMGKAHSHAFISMPHIYWPPPAIPKLICIAGRSEAAVAEASRRYGFERYTTDWRDLIEDPRIQVFDNLGPNDVHAEPSIAAAQAGKHVLCEKPLARTAEEAKMMWDAVEKTGVKHACAFNYRFVPAAGLARWLIQQGTLGTIYHFRGYYLQDWLADPKTPRAWRMNKQAAGAGALGDLCHVIDLARFLIGEPSVVSATTRTFTKQRPLPGKPEQLAEVDVDDAFAAMVEYENGAIGTWETSRVSSGRKNYQYVEVNGSEGSLWWELEDLNRVHVYFREEKQPRTIGFHDVLVTEREHPFMEQWWPTGHIVGWADAFVNQAASFLDAVANNKPVGPYQATFEDGYRVAVISDAILESARTGRRVDIKY